MLQREVLLREGAGDQNAGRQTSKHAAAPTVRGLGPLQTQKSLSKPDAGRDSYFKLMK